MKSTIRLRSFLALAGSSLLAICSANAQTTLANSYLTSLDVSLPVTLNSSLNFPSFLDGPLTGSSTLTTTGYFGSLLYLANNGAGNTFTGNITVDSGTLRITPSPFATTTGGFTAPSMTSSNTITINRAGTLFIDDNVTNGYTANRFGTVGQRPAVNLAGGTLSLNGLNNATSSVQTFSALTSSSGQGTINVTRNTAGNPTLAFDSLSISSGSLLTFNGTALGTGTNDARITFASAPTLTNGIIAGARFAANSGDTNSTFVTYGANGVRAFTASDFTIYAANDINAATSTQNAQMTGAFAPVTLTGDVAVNSLNYNGNGGTWSLGANKLTITSGMFLRNGTNAAVTINNGTLTAGNGNDDIDLNITTAQQNVTINAVIADNSASAVTLVKSGDTRNLTLSGGENNTYTGGTYVVGGTLGTGTTANRTYLGTGKVTVDGLSTLTLGSYGATSNSSGDDFTAINGGLIKLANVNHGGNGDTFNIAAGSVIYGVSGSNAGLASLTRGTNVTLAEDAIIGHDYSLTAALNLTTGTIQNLGTNADLYYGFNGPSNQTATGAVINIGTGTAFKGLAVYNGGGSFDGGTIHVTSGTTDVYLKTNGGNTAAPVNFTLGYEYWAGETKITLADAGTVDVNVLGNLQLRDGLSQFGDTSTGRNVRFVAGAGSNIQVLTAAGMGTGNGIASILIENGGLLAMNTVTNGFNGAVTVASGGRFDASLAGGVTGTGQLTFEEGSLINITHATGFSGSQASAASIAAGTIVRLNQNSFGAAGTTLDSVLGSGANAPIFVIYGNNRAAANPTAPDTAIMTLNKDTNGVGGILTNYELSNRGLSATTNGFVALGARGGTIASTTGNSMAISEDIRGSGSLTIGTTDIIDGLPKLGTVELNAVNTYTGGTIVNAGTLKTLNTSALGSTSGQLTVNTGGTLEMNNNSLTVGNLTGTGGVINGGVSGTRTLTIGQGDFGGGNYQGSIRNGTGGATALTKTGTGTITLSGDNTYTGATNINAGTLIINGSTSTSAVTVASGATLGGIGTLGGATTLNGTLSPGESPGTLTFNTNLTVNNGSTYFFEGGDLTVVNGILDLNDNWTLSLGLNLQNGGSVVLFEYGSLAASPDLDPTFITAGLGFTPGTLTLTDNGTAIVLNGVSVIPEPSAALLVGLSSLLLFRRRR